MQPVAGLSRAAVTHCAAVLVLQAQIEVSQQPQEGWRELTKLTQVTLAAAQMAGAAAGQAGA
jgi:hypothetical protein